MLCDRDKEDLKKGCKVQIFTIFLCPSQGMKCRWRCVCESPADLEALRLLSLEAMEYYNSRMVLLNVIVLFFVLNAKLFGLCAR